MFICNFEADMIQKTNQKETYSEMSITNLLHDLFDAHHYILNKAVVAFYEQYKKLQSGGKSIHADITKVMSAFIELEFFLKQHFKKEEQLFQDYIQKGTSHKVQPDALAEIRQEHEAIRFQLENIRRLSHHYHIPQEALPGLKLFYAQLFSIEQDLYRHMFLQEDFLFPKLIF
jgi:iron-sulfur cluster repair protein YtfE (RIC family)